MGSIKEQVYLEKLNQLKNQLQMLIAGTHSDYVHQLASLHHEYNETANFNKLCRQLEIDRIERDCDNEKTAALREFEEKRAELRESLVSELEERRRQIEHEYQTMELTGDNVEVKPMKTRNLRRRYNDPAPVNDGKRPRKASPTLNLVLSNAEINEDLKVISAAMPPPSADSEVVPAPLATSSPSYRRDRSPERTGTGFIIADEPMAEVASITDVSIEDGKLIYQTKCYTKGQPVYVETPDSTRTAAVVQIIGNRDVTLRLNNGKRMHVTITQLQQGKCTLWRRPS